TIVSNLYIICFWKEMPAEPPSVVPRFESAIPQKRAFRIWRRRVLHNRCCLRPRSCRISNPSVMKQFVDEIDYLGQGNWLTQRDQAVPHELRVPQITGGGKRTKNEQIRRRAGWKRFVEQNIRIRLHLQRARKRIIRACQFEFH